jgi:N-acetylneuraminic acid mutarotase
MRKYTSLLLLLSLFSIPIVAQITTTSQWTWMKGSSTAYQYGIYGSKGISNAANTPGGRYSAANWRDQSGNLWIYGGNGYSSSGERIKLNDLWKYNVATNQWTWVGGNNTGIDALAVYGSKGIAASTNTPGGRYGTTTWTDKTGNFWMFGGYGLSTGNAGHFNDLWKYNPSTNQWTWMSGNNTTDALGYPARRDWMERSSGEVVFVWWLWPDRCWELGIT